MPALVLVAAAWVAGLLAAHHWFVPLGIEPLSLVLLSLIPLAAILLWRHDRQVRLVGACVLVLFVAALRYQSAQPNLADPGLLAHYNNRGWVELEGMVDGYPDVRDTWTNLKVKAESLQDRRHYEARRLLSETRLPIKEVASALGFSSAAYFSRAFQAQTGRTPSSFRKNP